MKKIYNKPAMKVVEIKQRQQLLTGSDFGSGTKAGNEACAAGFDDFDDFDE